jgi:hypothetical protein
VEFFSDEPNRINQRGILSRQARMALVENFKLLMRTIEEFRNIEEFGKKEEILDLKN